MSSEYEVDLFPLCETSTCEYYSDDPVTFNGEDGTKHEWTCPECKTTYVFEVEFQPEIVNQVAKSGN
ncbi:hypothetical protein [Vibrio crassostreae]|uniref:hypothetical protein n=1 Tax=Vibrio crassostreae TaxID=246167 RepID=UPI001B307AAC|nr:hypothetical protein [Vibrio crassostreae]